MEIEEIGMTQSEKYEHGKLLRVAIDHDTLSEWAREQLKESLDAVKTCRDNRALGDGIACYSHDLDEDLSIFEEVIYAYRIVLSEYSIDGEMTQDIVEERVSL